MSIVCVFLKRARAISDRKYIFQKHSWSIKGAIYDPYDYFNKLRFKNKEGDFFFI